MRALHAAFLIAGLLLLAWLLYDTGLAALWGDIRAFGWGLALFLLLEAIADVFHSLGMQLCFPARLRVTPMPTLWSVRIAGSAINYLTPTATIGGEVAKVALLESHVPRSAAAAAILVDKLSYVVAQLGLAGLGTATLLWWIPIDRAIAVPLFVASVLIGLGCLGFFVFQMTGRIGPLLRRLLGERVATRALDGIGDIDGSLREYYREHPLALVGSIAWHVVGLSMGIVATWLFLWWVLGQASWLIAAAIWMIGTLVDIAAFLVPAGIGAQEGGRMLVFVMLGLSRSSGLAYGVVLRIEQMFFAVLGLLLYATLFAATPRSTTPAPAGTARRTDG